MLRFKFPYPLQWGPPTFAAGHAFAMMSPVLVSMIEVNICCILSAKDFITLWVSPDFTIVLLILMQSTAAYKAASRLAIATPPPAYVLSRGIGWQVSSSFQSFSPAILPSPSLCFLKFEIYL